VQRRATHVTSLSLGHTHTQTHTHRFSKAESNASRRSNSVAAPIITRAKFKRQHKAVAAAAHYAAAMNVMTVECEIRRNDLHTELLTHVALAGGKLVQNVRLKLGKRASGQIVAPS